MLRDGETRIGGHFRLSRATSRNICTAQVITQQQNLHVSYNVPRNRFNVQFRLQHGSSICGHKLSWAQLHNPESNLDSNGSLTAACVAAFAPPTIHSFNTHNAKYMREAVHPNNLLDDLCKQQRLQIECGVLVVGVGHILQVCREYEERLRRMPAVPRFSFCHVFN